MGGCRRTPRRGLRSPATSIEIRSACHRFRRSVRSMVARCSTRTASRHRSAKATLPTRVRPRVPLNVTLTGVILVRKTETTPELRMAMVRDNMRNESVALKVGMPLTGDQAGWTLVALAPRLATFRNANDETAEIELYPAAAPPPPKVAASTAGGTVGAGHGGPGQGQQCGRIGSGAAHRRASPADARRSRTPARATQRLAQRSEELTE